MKVVRGRDAHLYKRHSSASSYSLSSSSSHSIDHYFKNTCKTTATLSSSSDHIHRYFKYKYKNTGTNTTPFFLSSSSTDRVHCYFKYKNKQLKMQHYSIHFPCPLWISQSSWLDYKDMSFMWLPHLRSATINSRTSLTYCNDGQMNLLALWLQRW